MKKKFESIKMEILFSCALEDILTSSVEKKGFYGEETQIRQ